jgi:hypothetical protein
MNDMGTGRGAPDTQRQPDDDDEQSVLQTDASAYDDEDAHGTEDHDAEQEPEQLEPPRSQPIARFEGLKLRLRNPAADRYLLSVDVMLRLDDAGDNQIRDLDGQSQDIDGQLEPELEASEDEVAVAGAIDDDDYQPETPETETSSAATPSPASSSASPSPTPTPWARPTRPASKLDPVRPSKTSSSARRITTKPTRATPRPRSMTKPAMTKLACTKHRGQGNHRLPCELQERSP